MGRWEMKWRSWFYNVPDLNIVMPSSPDEAYWSFRDALNRPHPTLFFEDRSIHNRAGEITAESWGGKARTRVTVGASRSLGRAALRPLPKTQRTNLQNAELRVRFRS